MQCICSSTHTGEYQQEAIQCAPCPPPPPPPPHHHQRRTCVCLGRGSPFKTSKMWNIYGVTTATGPLRRYLVKTQSGWVLSLAVQAEVHIPLLTPLQQLRWRHESHLNPNMAPMRLSQDPIWLFSFCTSQSKKLGGRRRETNEESCECDWTWCSSI